MDKFAPGNKIILTRLGRKLENYLPHGSDNVTSLTLHGRTTVDPSSSVTLTLKYAGCLGPGRVILSLLSIATTCDIVGRSTAFSCTHSRAMLIHLIISNM